MQFLSEKKEKKKKEEDRKLTTDPKPQSFDRYCL